VAGKGLTGGHFCVFAQDEGKDELVVKVTPPGVLYGCERKRVAGKGICKTMKTKNERNSICHRDPEDTESV
jgi:hypothetical protein